MAHLPADDAIFALALAAWWQLRRSAYLLPHRRRGPASIGVHSGAGVRSWVRAITGQRTPMADPGDNRPTAEVLDTVPMAVPPPPATAWDAWATTPNLLPPGRQPFPHPRPLVTPPRAARADIRPTPTANRREPITRTTPAPPRGSL